MWQGCGGKQRGGLNEILLNFGPKQNQSFSVSCISSLFFLFKKKSDDVISIRTFSRHYP